MGVLVIYVHVFTVFCIVCTVFFGIVFLHIFVPVQPYIKFLGM